MQKIYDKQDLYDYLYEDYTFINYNVTNCLIEDCNFNNCTFINCTFASNKFNNTKLVDCTFVDCQLISIDWHILTTTSSLFLPFNSFKNCLLRYNIFEKLRLTKVDFSNNEILQCTFDTCNMELSNLSSTNLRDTLFIRCNLKKSTFLNASSYSIDPRSNDIKGATFGMLDIAGLLDCFEINIE